MWLQGAGGPAFANGIGDCDDPRRPGSNCASLAGSVIAVGQRTLGVHRPAADDLKRDTQQEHAREGCRQSQQPNETHGRTASKAVSGSQCLWRRKAARHCRCQRPRGCDRAPIVGGPGGRRQRRKQPKRQPGDEQSIGALARSRFSAGAGAASNNAEESCFRIPADVAGWPADHAVASQHFLCGLGSFNSKEDFADGDLSKHGFHGGRCRCCRCIAEAALQTGSDGSHSWPTGRRLGAACPAAEAQRRRRPGRPRPAY
mmetsp:Transcript_59/g.201  ORF Transcript_59/g.201 Transcript_59/m.201 type:complete len:258 (+) Transcript_59:1376-2149(+)